MKKEKLLRYSLILLSFAISALIILSRNELARLQGYGYLGIFLISVLGNATVIVPAPVIVTAFIGGGIYNPLVVGLLSGIGASFGELTGYMMGFGGQTAIKNNKHYKKVEGWMKKNGFLTIFLLALIPNPAFDLAGIISGISNYPMKKFFSATVLGKVTRYIVIAFLGSLAL